MYMSGIVRSVSVVCKDGIRIRRRMRWARQRCRSANALGLAAEMKHGLGVRMAKWRAAGDELGLAHRALDGRTGG